MGWRVHTSPIFHRKIHTPTHTTKTEKKLYQILTNSQKITHDPHLSGMNKGTSNASQFHLCDLSAFMVASKKSDAVRISEKGECECTSTLDESRQQIFYCPCQNQNLSGKLPMVYLALRHSSSWIVRTLLLPRST